MATRNGNGVHDKILKIQYKVVYGIMHETRIIPPYFKSLRYNYAMIYSIQYY